MLSLLIDFELLGILGQATPTVFGRVSHIGKETVPI
mgnify:CR=1 FL=1